MKTNKTQTKTGKLGSYVQWQLLMTKSTWCPSFWMDWIFFTVTQSSLLLMSIALQGHRTFPPVNIFPKLPRQTLTIILHAWFSVSTRNLFHVAHSEADSSTFSDSAMQRHQKEDLLQKRRLQNGVNAPSFLETPSRQTRGLFWLSWV